MKKEELDTETAQQALPIQKKGFCHSMHSGASL